MEAPARKPPRFWMVMQPSIIRLYKVAGLVALTAILVGLIGFLVVNIFYFFDHTWVRPVVLTPNHAKVIEAEKQLADARSRKSTLVSEKLDIEGQLAMIDRTVAVDEQLIADGTAADPKGSQWSIRHDVAIARLDKDNQVGRRAPLKARLEALGLLVQDQEQVVDRLSKSPYLRAINGKAVLAFVPYSNQRNVKIGTKLYGCSWGLIMCSRVGSITGTIEGEVENIHPHDESVQRGFMIEINLTNQAAEGDTVLFAGGKPLWLF